MNKTLILAAAALALVLAAPAVAACPLADCLATGEGCPEPEPVPGVPEVIDWENLDPRNWPCTCDPLPIDH